MKLQFDRFVSLIVYVPRDQYDSIARERIGNYFKTVYNGRVSAYYPAFPEGGVARVHFIIGRSEGKTPQIPQEQLEADVRSIVTRWEDQFRAIGGIRSERINVSRRKRWKTWTASSPARTRAPSRSRSTAVRTWRMTIWP